MSIISNTIGVFPLPICLLPNGITRLQIFEPCYLRLVSEAMKGAGFALTHFNKNSPYQSSTRGVLVEIIDFDRLSNQMLVIDIKAKSMIKLDNFQQEPDGLRRAQYHFEPHWSETCRDIHLITTTRLISIVHDLIAHHDELSRYYPVPPKNDSAWICARLLEILPLSFEKKEQLIFEQSFEQVLAFLHMLIAGEDRNTNV